MKYEIMHIDTVAACIDLQGRCKIYNENFLPYNLYLEESEAAIEGVKHIGLNQICKINAEWFKGRESEYEMFLRRLEVLKEIDKQHKEENVIQLT